MSNCAHPDHFGDALKPGESWVKRIRGLRANASRLSHEQLDAAEALDDGNPAELARQYCDLRARLGHITEIGRATSELQSLMRISYAVLCLKNNKTTYHYQTEHKQRHTLKIIRQSEVNHIIK